MGTMNEHSGFFKLENEDELDVLKPYTKLIENHFMTETDISKVLIEGDIATIMGVKYKRVEKPEQKTLTDILYLWWEDVFTTHSDWDMETSIDDLVTRIEEWWLPKEQSAAGSQNVDVEFLVEGFNDCLHKIKSKLR